MHVPSLERVMTDGLSLIVDPSAHEIGLIVAFTDRLGGDSPAPYSSLNLGFATGDDPANVDRNRKRVAGALGLEVTEINFVRQVHGTRVVARSTTPDDTLEEADGIALMGDGAAAVLAADCVPIVVSGRAATVALHAGWRGLTAGAVEAAVEAAGADPIAWVGPSIHACCYEVGAEVIAAFTAAGLPVADPSHVDPGRAAVVALGRAGVARTAAWHECTSCTTVADPPPGGGSSRFFSHRRDAVTGRQCGIVAVRRGPL